jgi:hypothetical protein
LWRNLRTVVGSADQAVCRIALRRPRDCAARFVPSASGASDDRIVRKPIEGEQNILTNLCYWRMRGADP